MIPKKIHYCWFGGNPLPELALKCIESWRKYCPDYEIIEWNESNFDVNSCDYVKEAYQAEKWAFVSDYARLSIIEMYGGIYMDTDVELIGGLDKFLCETSFSGFEKEGYIPTGIMGCEKGSEWIKKLLSYYDNRHFVKEDGSLDTTTNTVSITNTTKSNFNISLNGDFQKLDGVLTLYPKDYFCPKNHYSGEIVLTENTVAIHHFDGSWHSPEDRYANELKKKLFKIFKGKFVVYLAQIIAWAKFRGIKATLKLLIGKRKK